MNNAVIFSAISLAPWRTPQHSSTTSIQMLHMVLTSLFIILTPWEVWGSFHQQIWSSVKYGLVPLTAYSAEVDNMFSTWYYSCVPKLVINWHICKEWRTLPVDFYELSHPNITLKMLSNSLQFLEKHWGQNTEYDKALWCVFELTQSAIKLAGNFGTCNFNNPCITYRDVSILGTFLLIPGYFGAISGCSHSTYTSTWSSHHGKCSSYPSSASMLSFQLHPLLSPGLFWFPLNTLWWEYSIPCYPPHSPMVHSLHVIP